MVTLDDAESDLRPARITVPMVVPMGTLRAGTGIFDHKSLQQALG